jgi:hypothetical protein
MPYPLFIFRWAFGAIPSGMVRLFLTSLFSNISWVNGGSLANDFVQLLSLALRTFCFVWSGCRGRTSSSSLLPLFLGLTNLGRPVQEAWTVSKISNFYNFPGRWLLRPAFLADIIINKVYYTKLQWAGAQSSGVVQEC